MRIKELENAVNQIQQEIYESSEANHFNITLTSNEFEITVDFCGIELWSSENDLRELLDDSETQLESIDHYLRKALREELEILQKIKIAI